MPAIFTSILEFWYIMLVVFILGRFIYYPNQGKRQFLFAYLLLAAIISVLCMIISRVNFGIGFALGIFAVFSTIRYRTEPISPREMTYIFLSAGIAAKNALVLEEVALYKMLLADAFILITAGLAEYCLFRGKPMEKLIVYDNLNLIQPDKRDQLIQDLQERFGIYNIDAVQVGKIDTIKNSVRLMVHFKDKESLNFNDGT